MALNKTEYSFTHKKVTCFFDGELTQLKEQVSSKNIVIITDENIYALYQKKLDGYKCIVIKAGEMNKQQSTVDYIIHQLINLKADRKTFIIGLGGGVVTDIAGYIAGIYMRGLSFAFVPTTILGMVDAAIGGKNGIDVGLYKNLVGTIRQPDFILFDYSFLKTLPHDQWVNGFAEIIKHACIGDVKLFTFLENNAINDFKTDTELLAHLIEKNVQLKTAIVLKDEFENAERKLLNFGHTFGHAIENEYNLLHGHAISIGMVMAATISEEINNFYSAEKERLVKLLKKYELPVRIKYEPKKVIEMMQLDKKSAEDQVNYILLNKIGEAVIQPISVTQLQNLMYMYQ